MSVISWEEPPVTSLKDWVAIVAELRGQPRRWAHVATYGDSVMSGQIASQLRTGRINAAGPAGSVEAKAKKVDGEYRVYARYVGGDSS